MTVDFSKLLNVRNEDIAAPKALPAGTYEGVIQKFQFGESAKKGTPYLELTIGIQSASADVLPEDLEGIDLGKKTLRHSFFITEDSLYRLRDFVVSCGIDGTGRTLNEQIPDLIQQPVLIEVSQRPNPNDPTVIYNDIAKISGMGA